MSYFEDVVRWHKRVGHPVERTPTIDQADPLSVGLAIRLIEEEYSELRSAWFNDDLVEIADGAADLIWVICGAMARIGIDLDSVWDEVRRSNFEKVGGPSRGDGKLLKPEGWKPPNIEGALKCGRYLDSEV